MGGISGIDAGRRGGDNRFISSHCTRGAVNGATNTIVGATPAQIGDGRVDVSIGWARVGFQQGSSGHDHARLAISALRDLFGDPRLLHWVAAVTRKGFDRRDEGPLGLRDRDLATSHRAPIDVDSARAAIARAAAVFGACQVRCVADCP